MPIASTEPVFDLGERDTRSIRRVMRVAQLLSIAGRSLPMFAFYNPRSTRRLRRRAP
jgi:hypothetical protein